jgi:hypothetical protein
MKKSECYETLRKILHKRYSDKFIKSPSFLKILKSREYENLSEVLLVMSCYSKIILTKDILNSIFIELDENEINEKLVPLRRSISRGNQYQWVINEYINENGMFHCNWSQKVKVKNEEFVPSKNIFEIYS